MTLAAAAPAGAPIQATAAPAATSQVRARIEKTAHQFEASFLSVMLGEMFQGISSSGPFGGGDGEAAFKSFLTDSMAKSMASHGGVGLSHRIAQEMLQLQGLKTPGAAA